MATTDTALASTEEIRRALGKLYELQEDDPNLIEGLFVKYPEKNPFTTWPLLKEPTEAFLRFFETTTTAPEQGAETITPQAGQYIETTTPLPNAIDAKKLEDLIDEFNTEIEAAKQGRLRASDAAKKFVAALKENAKRSNVVIPETQESVVQERESAPVPPERVQQIISATLQQPLPAEEQRLFFHALTSFASEEPNREVADLSRRATEVTETARVLSSPASTFPQAQSLSALATNSFQKGVARALDVVVPAAAKEAIINKILLQPLNNFVNHPEKIPQDVLGTMTDRWGANFVNSSWFAAIRADANRMMGDQKSALKVTTPLVSFVSDVATTVFRGPVTINVITYVETYRLVATQGVQMVSFPQYGSVALGYGSQLVHMGANYAIRKGVKAGVKAAAEKVAVSTAVKVGAEAVVGAGTAGIGTLVMLGADLLRGLVNKGLSVFKNLVGMGTSNAPEDKLLLVVGAGVVLVFFLPIFPLLNLPAFNQSMIDTSLATVGTSGGMSNDSPIPPPNFGPINGSITDCITSQGTNIEGTQTLTLSADRASRIQDISQKYPQLGCYSQVLNCPTTKINITAFAVQAGGLGGYAPSAAPGNIIFYPAFFQYDDYYFARTLAHEMMHEVQWFHSNIYDAFMSGTADGSLPKGYCGPLGTYKAGDENSYETMAEAAGLYMVGNPLLQQKCQPAYNFMRTLFSQCQK